MTTRVSRAAREDVLAAARFYDARPGRYGDAFNDEFRAAVAAIAANPRMYPPAEDGPPGIETRECFIARFQQRVIFTVTGDDALVVAVVHAARRPGSWHRGLASDG